MSSYLSSILTTTTSRYNSLRRTLLSDESDGDTEDDSHISRVLRAYYTEKGRPFPPWLPPDPKAPQPSPAQFVAVSGRGGQVPPQAMGRGAGGLSDLWDSPRNDQEQAPASMSLRRTAQNRPTAEAAPRPSNLSRRSDAMRDPYRSGGGMPPPEQRPLPSQRHGSYQNSFAQQARLQAEEGSTSRPTSASSGTSAQERLKARLLGGNRSTSPNPTPPAKDTRNPYDYASPGPGPSAPSDGRSGPSRDRSPYVGATSPWTSSDPYADPGGSSRSRNNANPYGRQAQGRPGGPR